VFMVASSVLTVPSCARRVADESGPPEIRNR
jgi:hypothetical protein